MVTTSLLQRNISKALPNKAATVITEILLLLLFGAIAVILHAKLRLPLQLPGKHGLIFMAIIAMSRYVSDQPFAASLTCLGSSMMLLAGGLGFHDPFLFLAYAVLGIVMDGLFLLSGSFKKNIFVLAIAGALSWAALPLIRLLLSFLTGFLDPSLSAGLLWSLSTHLVFGFTGSLAGLSLVKLFDRKK
jgi:hypothetical protein